MNQIDVFELNGKTWVAYRDPIVRVKVITEDNCAECQPDQALIWFRRVVPTILTEKITVDSEQGKTLIKANQIKTIPSFIFSKEIESTDFFQQAQPIFEKKGEDYLLNGLELGIPVGKYLELPSVSENDIKIGLSDSKVKVIEFIDFQCPYCKIFQMETVDKLLKEYKDRILFVFKNLPLDFHPQAQNAALAGECAAEQGKFVEYAGKLFSAQDDWGKSENTQKFKTYALQLGLNGRQFNGCLDSKKYADKIEKDKQEARNFGITGTPAIFINSQFKNGAADYAAMKEIVEQELAK
jgi:protein-disulfide isomerase